MTLHRPDTGTAILALACGFALLLPWKASAQQMLDEIVVTAQRRAENLQDVPISVNAFTADMVEKQRIQDFHDLGLAIPGFSINTFSKSRMNPSLRGGSSSLSGAGADGAVGMFIDDMYYGGPGDFEIDLFDVERIEVLRGPQGTLFGRNTTGGAIVVTTKDPGEELEGKLEATYGGYDLLQFRGLVSGPLTDNLFGSLAFSSTDRDGTSFNRTTGNDIDNTNRASVRGKLRWVLDNDLEAKLSFGFSKHDESGLARDQIFGVNLPVTHEGLVDVGFVPETKSRVTNQFSDGDYVSEQFTAGLHIEKGLEYGQLLSITSGRYFDSHESLQTITGSPVPVYAYGEPREATVISQEFRFLSELEGPLNFVSGFYFYHADEERTPDNLAHWDLDTTTASFQAATFCPFQDPADTAFFLVTPACTGPGLVTAGNRTVTLDSLYELHEFTFFERVDTTSYAVFTEAKYDILDSLTLTGGVRWTHDKKDMEGGTDGDPDFFFNPVPGLRVSDEESWGEVTYRVGLDWHVTDDIMLYGTTSKGFRSGAYDVAQSDPALSSAPVDPEIVFSHEIGMKSSWFNDRVRLNVTAFDVTYENLQFFVNTGAASITTNAGEASVQGVEVDFLAAITEALTFRFQFSHQDGDSEGIPAAAEIPDGTPPQGTVPYTYIAALDYSTPLANGGQLSMGVDFTHKEPYGLEFNDVPQFVSEVEALVNARISYRFPGDQWEISLWGKNLTDEDIVVYGQDFWFALYDTNTFLVDQAIQTETAQPRYADPLTWGITVGYSF